jgi:hypothetical protein
VERVILLGGSDSGADIMNLVDLDFLGKPRRLTIRINRIDPGLFSEAFLSWVRKD